MRLSIISIHFKTKPNFFFVKSDSHYIRNMKSVIMSKLISKFLLVVIYIWKISVHYCKILIYNNFIFTSWFFSFCRLVKIGLSLHLWKLQDFAFCTHYNFIKTIDGDCNNSRHCLYAFPTCLLKADFYYILNKLWCFKIFIRYNKVFIVIYES